jgi:maltose alpha-D-glucosyltransferase/alpha-amylase
VTIANEAVTLLERELLRYLPAQRWFADKGRAIDQVRLLDVAELGEAMRGAYAAVFELPEIERRYFVPFAIDAQAAGERDVLARIRHDGREAAVCEGFASDTFVLAILDDVRGDRRRSAARGGTFAAHATPHLGEHPLHLRPHVRRMRVEQTNTSVVVDETVMLKGYRRTHFGPQPELEVARFLDRVGYENTPALLGFVEYERADAAPMAVCILQRFVATEGDGWSTTLAHLEGYFAQPEDPGDARFIDRMRRLGVRTAELHRAFATPEGDEAFEPEPTTGGDLRVWVDQARETAQRALARLEAELGNVPEQLRAGVEALLARRDEIVARIAAPPLDERTTKTRYHGDYHLGQVLVVGDDFMIVDFEGEPGRPPEVRRRKSSPLRDVAGMLRSLNYAAVAGTGGLHAREPLARNWEHQTAVAFLDGYRTTIAGCSSYPADPAHARALLDLFVLEKAFYEISYELANRPSWLRIPLEGIRAVLDRDAAH